MGKSRTLVYDIETCFAIGVYFGRTYDVNIAKTILPEHLFGFAWQWLGEKKIRTCYIWDFPEFNKPLKFKGGNLESVLEQLKERQDLGSKLVAEKWSELVLNSDILVGHNSDQFDYRQMHGRIVEYGLPPIPKPQQVDTKKIAKRLGYYDSNSLDNLSKRFGHGGKLSHEGIEMWWKCMNGDTKAQKHMVKYNKVDVKKTTDLYLKFRPYDDRHPNIANIEGRPDACPKCGVEGLLWAQGVRYTKTGQYRRWQCKACGSYVSERKQEKTDRPQYV